MTSNIGTKTATTRRILFAVIAIVTVIIIVFLLSSRKDKSEDIVQVRIATFSNAVDYAPFYIAKTKGFFDEEFRLIGAKAEFSTFEALGPLNDALAGKRVDAVFEAEPPAFISEAAGIDVTIPYLSVTLSQKVIARKDTGVDDVSDLKGKTVGVLTGTSSHYGLLEALSLKKIEPESVTIVNMPPPEGRASFRSGDIDAWAVWPPFPEVEELDGRAVEVANTETTIHSVLVVREKFAVEHEPSLQAIIRALEKSQAFIRDEPQEAKKIVAESVNLPIEVVSRAWPKHQFGPELNQAVVDDFQKKADFLNANGFIDNPLNVKSDLFSEGSIK